MKFVNTMLIQRFYSKIEPFRDFIFPITICIVVVILIWVNIIPDFICYFNLTQRTLISSSFSAIIAIILIYFSYSANRRLQYFNAVKAVIQEMRHNYNEMEKFHSNFKDAYGDCDNLILHRWNAKSPSLTNWGDGENFHLKYLPSQAYFNFINNGYINQKKYLEFPAESIAHFYQFCIEFSNDLQILENTIRGLKTGKLHAPVPITLSRFPERQFESPREICKFLNEVVYPFYADENPLNDGIKKEYKKTIKSLTEHDWLISDEESMKDFWQKMKDNKRPLTKRTSVGIGLIVFGLLTTMILTVFYGSTPLIGPVFISIGIGVYFLGLTVTLNGLIAQDENEILLNKILELSEKIDKIQK